MGNLLYTNGISKKFNGIEIVKPSSISLEKGSIHVIEGKSGSGKSTFLSMLGGLEKPDTGNVIFNGRSFYNLKDKDQSLIRGMNFGYIFQSFNLMPELTVKENIELPLQFNKKKQKANYFTELVEALEINQHLNKKPDYLSGGEQQRVAIARALIMEPEIIFADEPTGNLDQITTRKVTKLLTDLTIKMNIALIVVTHEKNLFSHTHKLYYMENGKLNEVNNPND